MRLRRLCPSQATADELAVQRPDNLALAVGRHKSVLQNT